MKVLVAVVVALCLVGCGEPEELRPSNHIYVIAPYWHRGTWKFDDEQVGLRGEPFVYGIPELIEELTVDVPNARKGFQLFFSAEPMPEYDMKLIRGRKSGSGNYYTLEGTKKEGWLCAALYRYYRTAPDELYVKAEEIKMDTEDPELRGSPLEESNSG